MQKYLRHPREISGQEEWSWFQAMIRHLDDAIARSTLQPGDLVFRGVRSDFTKRLLFLLSIDAGECSEDGFHLVTPHVIQDQGYSSFTRNARQFFSGKGDTRVLLVHQTNSSDRAIEIRGKDPELLYPRAFLWMTTGFACISMNGARTISSALIRLPEESDYMAGTIRLFPGKEDAVIFRAPVILSKDAESTAEQVLSRAVREFSSRKE